MKSNALAAFAILGILTVPGAFGWTDDFESGLSSAWHVRGTTESLQVVPGGRGGGSCLEVKGRTTTWQGPARALVPQGISGGRYRVSAWVRYPQGPDKQTFQLSVELGYKDPDAAHVYKNLAAVTVARGEWALITFDYPVPQDENLALAEVYWETPYKADSQVGPDDRVDFDLDDVSVEALPDAVVQVQDDIPRLRDVLAGVLPLGAAVTPEMVDPSDPHFRLLTKHYGVIVAGNAMKPESLQPREGVFRFAQADKLVAFADRTGTRLRGHTLVWHNQTPAWFFEDPDDPAKVASKALLLQRLKDHITTVASHFAGEVDTWDVVNEVVSDRSGLRTGDEGSRWYEIAGPDYIEAAFRAARAADPNAKLAINDYNLESDRTKQDTMVELVKGMKERGVPVDVVGLQGHISLYGPSVDDFRQAIERFSALGVKVQVTELDVSVYRGASEAKKDPTPDLMAQQARRYAELFAMFREEAAAGRLDMVVLWGTADDDTWLDNFPVLGRPDAPLLFDRNLQAKPAFWAVAGQEN
jgi:endo-1,4-beta-xylanase